MFNKGNVQNAVTLPDGQQAVFDALAVPAKALMDTPQIAADIEKGVNTFMEAAPILMSALDRLADIHAFVAGMASPVLRMLFLSMIYQLPSPHSRPFMSSR